MGNKTAQMAVTRLDVENTCVPGTAVSEAGGGVIAKRNVLTGQGLNIRGNASALCVGR